MNAIIQYPSLRDWLTSHSIMLSRFIYTVVLPEFPSVLRPICIMWLDHILFFRSSVHGHRCCSHLLAVVNNAPVNIGGQVSAFSSQPGLPKAEAKGQNSVLPTCSVGSNRSKGQTGFKGWRSCKSVAPFRYQSSSLSQPW